VVDTVRLSLTSRNKKSTTGLLGTTNGRSGPRTGRRVRGVLVSLSGTPVAPYGPSASTRRSDVRTWSIQNSSKPWVHSPAKSGHPR